MGLIESSFLPSLPFLLAYASMCILPPPQIPPPLHPLPSCHYHTSPTRRGARLPLPIKKGEVERRGKEYLKRASVNTNSGVKKGAAEPLSCPSLRGDQLLQERQTGSVRNVALFVNCP